MLKNVATLSDLSGEDIIDSRDLIDGVIYWYQ